MTDEKKYEKWIKSLPCVHCMIPDESTWHHAIGYGHGLMAGKSHWLMTVPMCIPCHNEFHRDFKTDRNHCVMSQLRWIESTLKKAVAHEVITIGG